LKNGVKKAPVDFGKALKSTGALWRTDVLLNIGRHTFRLGAGRVGLFLVGIGRLTLYATGKHTENKPFRPHDFP
jgi:hypothetical protein